MAEKDKEYRTVHGIIQFEPREGEAGGKKVRNIVVREVGFKEQSVRVSATVWPSHKHLWDKLEEGTVVTMEGSYQRNVTTNDDGEKKVYHNLSVSKLFVHGLADPGKKPKTTSDDEPEDAEDDEDIPF